jgi:NAD(P)-dependent dehydrogenase (short-subunit alcohol dehydrogenase family)
LYKFIKRKKRSWRSPPALLGTYQNLGLSEIAKTEASFANPRFVLYLCSDLASFVTGSVHVVDGGETVD